MRQVIKVRNGRANHLYRPTAGNHVARVAFQLDQIELTAAVFAVDAREIVRRLPIIHFPAHTFQINRFFRAD